MNIQSTARDAGLTLIELLIAIMLAVGVLLASGGMLISSLLAERTVTDATGSSNFGQLAAKSVSHGVFHASELAYTTPTVDSELLMALIIDDAVADPAIAHCEAWHVGGGEVRWTQSSTAITSPASAADAAGWTLLAEGVEPIGTSPVLAVAGLSVDLNMQLSGVRDVPILISTTAVSRQPANIPTEVEDLCF